jgi:serine/threonine protein kinase
MKSEFGPDGGTGDDEDEVVIDEVLVERAAELADRMQVGEEIDPKTLSPDDPGCAGALRALLPSIAFMADLGASEPDEENLGERSPSDPGMGVKPVRLGDFRLIREVGRGGMGVVYEADQLSLGRRVALKILPAGVAIDRKRLRRFQLEAQAAALLHHPHIVPVHTVGSDRGVHFFAMQFIDGRTLADLIGELRRSEGIQVEPAGADELASMQATKLLLEVAAPPPVDAQPVPQVEASRPALGRAYFDRVAAIGRQAAEALEHAHQQGVVHRDIKPGNLMIDDSGCLWVTDFGLARLQGDPGVTMTNDLLGTMRYMSPEQALGRPAVVDHRSDVYSLSVTLYELLTLQPAFDGSDRAEVLRKIAEEEPAHLRRLDRTIPADLETIVATAMEKDPARRYATAGAMAEDLRRYLEHVPILARRPTLLDRMAKWSRRHWPVVALAAGFALLAVVALVSDLTWSNRWLRSHNNRLSQALARADEYAREAERQRGIAQAQLELAGRHRRAESLRRAGQALEAHQFDLAQDILHDVQPPAGSTTGDFVWHNLWRQATRDFCKLWGHQATVTGCAVAPDGGSLATIDREGNLLIWDLRKGMYPDRLRLALPTPVGDAILTRFSPDGRYLAVEVINRNGEDHGIGIFDPAS